MQADNFGRTRSTPRKSPCSLVSENRWSSANRLNRPWLLVASTRVPTPSVLAPA